MTTLKSLGTIQQNLIDCREYDITTSQISVSALTQEILCEALTGSATADIAKHIAIACTFSTAGKMDRLALVVGTRALVVQLEGSRTEDPSQDGARAGGRAGRGGRGGRAGGGGRGAGGGRSTFEPSERSLRGRQVLDTLFSHPEHVVLAFDLARIALALFLQQEMALLNGIDVQDCMPNPGGRDPLAVIQFAVGEDVTVFDTRVPAAFAPATPEDKMALQNMVCRAWAAAYICGIPTSEAYIYAADFLTTYGRAETVKVLAEKDHEAHRTLAQQSTSVKHNTEARYDTKIGKLHVKSHQFSNNITASTAPPQVQVMTEYGPVLTSSTVMSHTGKNTVLEVGANLDGMKIGQITSAGDTRQTRAEALNEERVLHILQNKDTLFNNPWSQTVYEQSGDIIWPALKFKVPYQPPALVMDAVNPLNPSQELVVTTMLSSPVSNHVMVVQGPPGTGKTSVIATYVNSATSAEHTGIWLVAQSNIAVKNIAEKLLKVGFTNFRILVSKDFHEGWHEHLYQGMGRYTILSNRFKEASGYIKGVQVFLCTLSMLSSPKLGIFTKVSPLRMLVVDEASQIGTKDYLYILNRYAASLQRLVFIGDDKQLPPFGGEAQSIFEVMHLQQNRLFLDTQYRMPPQIGSIISKEVYDSKLKSWADHPITAVEVACHFIDVGNGRGVTPPAGGTSLINTKEKDVIILLASKMQEDGLSYRIITPYDAQRDLIEKGLQENGIDWHDRVHNVDSFQGNEDHIIIISVVRHRELGFLQDLRRTNVMLTRCKTGMYICTSKAYLGGDGKESLVAALAKGYGEPAWMSVQDVEGGNF